MGFDKRTKDFKLYILPHKLNWYQKIFQKLHIKNYYKEIAVVKDVQFDVQRGKYEKR